MPQAPVASLRLIDVADAAGVSIATASRALVRHARGQRGGRRRGSARSPPSSATSPTCTRASLAGGASRTVGLVVHEIGDPYFSEIASGVLGVAAEQGLTVQICHTGRDPETELRQIRSLIAHRVGAIIDRRLGVRRPGGGGAGARHELPALPARRAGGWR